MNKIWLKAPFLYFCIAAILGVLLRWIMTDPIEGINYKYLLHTHSHLALLGWVYLALYFGMTKVIKAEGLAIKPYRKIMYFTQVTVLGMLFSFPLQGYGAVSITFSTLFLFASYWFAIKFYKDINQSKARPLLSSRFFKVSLIYLIISSIGPWALGALMANKMGGTDIYYLSIYFYLHFMYNGFFTFAVMGLFFRWLEDKKVKFDKSKGRRFFYLLHFACIPAFALSALWMKPHLSIYIIGGIAAVFQLIAFYFLTGIIKKTGALALIKSKTTLFLIQGSLFAFGIKLLLQAFSAFPVFAEAAYQNRDFVIAYLHLTLIGFISLFIIGYYGKTGELNMKSGKSKSGLALFVLGFVLMELILFLRPALAILNYPPPTGHQDLLLGASMVMAAGLVLFSVGGFKR